MITYKIYCITNMITHEHYIGVTSQDNIDKRVQKGNCCRGTRKTCGGYHWEYLDEKGGDN